MTEARPKIGSDGGAPLGLRTLGRDQLARSASPALLRYSARSAPSSLKVGVGGEKATRVGGGRRIPPSLLLDRAQEPDPDLVARSTSPARFRAGARVSQSPCQTGPNLEPIVLSMPYGCPPPLLISDHYPFYRGVRRSRGREVSPSSNQRQRSLAELGRLGSSAARSASLRAWAECPRCASANSVLPESSSRLPHG